MITVRKELKRLSLLVALISAEDFHPTGEYNNRWFIFTVIVTETLSNAAYIEPTRFQHVLSF